ncbi:ASCH domain-containing protein [Bifidobacterium sp. W8109]|uniref:ASCH domain-containing protein n=1 Tax=Bifidobacterium asteroides TaxID=1684 RepID=A0ABS3IWI3_9BIFI|nr:MULTISPECIES: ASCH domain-containing protein [Bifidobacterium]MBH9970808.1 ASCH domain-containing protein [Bifidobacterium asteroides]MBI0072869.1 ASCH domain-containing protein [Bifidobacterium sp. W8110]MCP8614103.1 ASCH domain-containing protein [Bifidobacterium asteroides]
MANRQIPTVKAQDVANLPKGEFAFPGPERDCLVEVILDGRKTATTSLMAKFIHDHEQLLASGRRTVLLNSDDQHLAVLRYASVGVNRLGLVILQHVLNEGEDYKSFPEWRLAHESFWTSENMRQALDDRDFNVDDQTPVVLETFHVEAMVVN